MKCKKCQSDNLVIRPNAKNVNATELICAECGAWQKFVSKEEIRLFEIKNQQQKQCTKGDCIRSMNDEELAAFLEGLVIVALGDYSLRDNKRRLEWLRQPAKEEQQ